MPHLDNSDLSTYYIEIIQNQTKPFIYASLLSHNVCVQAPHLVAVSRLWNLVVPISLGRYLAMNAASVPSIIVHGLYYKYQYNLLYTITDIFSLPGQNLFQGSSLSPNCARSL